MAVISRRQVIPHFDVSVDAYLFTTILYESPKLLLNVGMGDYGEIDTTGCSCPFGDLGFNVALGNINSYEKLTGEGVTFVDTDFVRILEYELPATFGGQSTDYQLLEEEDAQGLTRLQLLVSPRVGPLDERAVIEKFMRLLRTSEASPESWAQSGVEMWRQAGMVSVRRQEPLATSSGKILPFFLRNAHPVPATV
jgi:hypothetical protein